MTSPFAWVWAFRLGKIPGAIEYPQRPPSMPLSVQLLAGLPPYGPMAMSFPKEWGLRGHEGVVCEFKNDDFCWVGNFSPGLYGITFAAIHPNQRDAVVYAKGHLWSVDPVQPTASLVLQSIESAMEVRKPDGWLLNISGLAIARFGPDGLLWHTKRLSWDGFTQLALAGDELTGLACEPSENSWAPFRVDIRNGSSTGGSHFPEKTLTSNWERLANPDTAGSGE